MGFAVAAIVAWPILLITCVKPYYFGFWGMFYEIVKDNNDVIYTFVVFFNVQHKKFP